jgi:hypothetical protein
LGNNENSLLIPGVLNVNPEKLDDLHFRRKILWKESRREGEGKFYGKCREVGVDEQEL